MENPFDLRAFLAKIDAAGQLRTITGAALDTEVGALTELNGQRQGPALLFGGFEGYPRGLSRPERRDAQRGDLRARRSALTQRATTSPCCAPSPAS